MSGVQPLSDRDKEMLDPRVSVALHKERIAPDVAIRERVREAERRNSQGGAR